MYRLVSFLAVLTLVLASACGPGVEALHDPDGSTLDPPDAGAGVDTDGGPRDLDGGPGDAGTDAGGDDPGEVMRTTATVGPDGGVLRLPGTTLVFQAGSLAEDTQISLERHLGTDPVALDDDTWRIEPEGLALINEAFLRITHPPGRDDMVLMWNRHPDFGPGVDRLDGWQEEDVRVTALQYLGSGHLATPGTSGVSVYRPTRRVYETTEGIETIESPVSAVEFHARLGDVTTYVGPVGVGSDLVRLGVLPPDATGWLQCDRDGHVCTGDELALPRRAEVNPGRPVTVLDGTQRIYLSDPSSGDCYDRYHFAVVNADATGRVTDTTCTYNWSALDIYPDYGDALDAERGEEAWIFRFGWEDEAPGRRRSVLTGQARVEGWRAAAFTRPSPGDSFTVAGDAAAWQALFPDATWVSVTVYASWAKYEPDPEHGTELLRVSVPFEELDTVHAWSVPEPPEPEWQERVLLEVGDVTWDLFWSEADGRILPAPAAGAPPEYSLAGSSLDEPNGRGSFLAAIMVDGTRALVAEWMPPTTGEPLTYVLACEGRDPTTREKRSWTLRTSGTHAVVDAAWMAQFPPGSRISCRLSTRLPARPLLDASRALLKSERIGWVEIL